MINEEEKIEESKSNQPTKKKEKEKVEEEEEEIEVEEEVEEKEDEEEAEDGEKNEISPNPLSPKTKEGLEISLELIKKFKDISNEENDEGYLSLF